MTHYVNMTIIRPQLRPIVSKSAKVTALDSLWEVINDFHLDYISLGVRFKGWNYVVVEANGAKFVSRVTIDGIGRKGGVKPKEPTLDELRDMLGVEASDILSDDWIGGDDD